MPNKEMTYEPLYELLVKVYKCFSDNFQGFIILCSIITLVPIFYVIKENVRIYRSIAVLVIILTVLVQSFSIIRAYLGIAFMFLAFNTLNFEAEKVEANKKTYLYALISVLFHYSMLVFVIIYLLSKRKWSKNTYYIIIFCSM